MKHAPLIATAIALFAAPAFAEGDAEAGEKIFKKCSACHSIEPGKRKPGPHLAGIYGRPAASVEEFKYSKAMKASDIIWDEASLSAFLKAPKAFVKGTKMSFRGIKKDQELADLLAYLEGL